jgi:cytochrome P450
MNGVWYTDDFDIGHAKLPGQLFHQMLADFRERGAVVDVRFYGRPAKLITRYDALQQAFRDEDRFPPEVSYQLSTEPVVGRTFISMPQREHNVYRKLAAPFFNRGAINSLEEDGIRELCHQLLAPLLQAGGGDLVARFTRPLPLLVIGRMLGIPIDNNTDLQHWAMDLLSFPVDPKRALAAAAQFSAMLLPIIRQRRLDPSDDVISALIQSRIDDQLLSDEDIASHIRLLFPTGADTTFLALGNLIHALQTEPDSWRMLVDQPTLIPKRWKSCCAGSPQHR